MKLSPLDTARWQAVTATASDLDAQNLPAMLEFCREHHVQLAIVRCAARDLRTAQALEQAGFRIMDTLVYYSRSLAGGLPETPGKAQVRELRDGEDAAVGDIAGKAFSGYAGHYHADPRLDPLQCDQVYVDWARRSCTSRQVADAVLVAELDHRLVAFATLRLNNAEEGEGVLFGVAPEAQGHGIYRALMAGGMRWCATQGRSRMVVSTQVTNIAVQKVWVRLGFEPSASYYTFHNWF